MFIGCDISGQLKKDKYWILGSVWIPKEQLPQYEEAVCCFRLKNKLWGELKWTGVSPQKLKGYKEFLTLSLEKFPMVIKVILLEKKIVKLKEFYRNNEGKMFSTFFYLLLRSHMRRSPITTSFTVLLDKEGWIREQTLPLRDFLESFLFKGGFKKAIEHLSQCDSKICSLLQFIDLINGAISTKWNQSDINISTDKKEIIKHIEGILNHSLLEPTLPTATRFNLWLWRPSINFNYFNYS